jgi:hypothetical protein
MKTALLLASALVFVGGSIEVDAKPRAKTAKTAKKAKKAKKPTRAKKPAKAPPVEPSAPDPAPAEIAETAAVVEVAPTPVPEPVAEPAAEPAAESVVDSSVELAVAASPAPRVRRVRISIDDGPVMRQLRYVDDWATDGNTVRDYDLVANAIGVSVAARPLLAVPAELYARGELVIGVSGSQGPDDEVYSTRSSEIQFGALLGGTLGRVNAGIAIAAGQHSFTIADEMSTRGELVPDTRYRYVRLGGAVGVPLGSRVNVTADAGYRMLTTSGDLASTTWFPWATGDGVDASLGVDVRVTQTIHAYVRGSVRRYFFAMNPEPGDALVVGGAIDQYLGLAAGLGFAIH